MPARRPASQAERARAFGNEVRRLRKQRKLSQRELAQTIPMSPGNLSRIEAGEVGPPSDEVIEALATTLDADRSELFHLAGRELDRMSFQRQVLAELGELRESLARLGEPGVAADVPPPEPSTAMTFEQTLSALQGFIGRKVGIAIGDALPDGHRLVGTIQGTLAGGLEVPDTESDPPSDTLYFHLREEPTSGFYLHRERFRGAWWNSDGSGELIVFNGALRIAVSESAPDEP